MVCPTRATIFSTKDIWLIGNRRGTNSYARWCGGNSGDEPLTYPISGNDDTGNPEAGSTGRSNLCLRDARGCADKHRAVGTMIKSGNPEAALTGNYRGDS